ncbi:putative ribonuclease H-like domain-containing protein [Tanacetum coccineum]
MDLGQNNSLAKLPLLKQGEYDTWRLRIESYIQLQDYSLWEIIEEGNSFKPVAQTTREVDGTSTTTIPGAVTHLLTFNKHKDAKSLFEAIEARFCGNEATKKTQKTLLKQMYETFSAFSSESLDSIFNRLQKIVSQLTILGEIITPEELNLKFLRSLPTEWGHSSRNDDNIANVHVSTGSSPVSTASTNNSTACLSDATVYAYLSTQPNGSQVVHEDLEQIHEDDLDEMDLKWQLALLSMKVRKFYQRTGKKIVINGRDTASYDKKKVECFNYHKLGHFARECRNPKSQENRSRSQDSSRRTVNVKEASPKAMLAIDGTGFDWSYMAQEEASTNFALMTFFDSEIVVLKRDASYKDSDINGLEKQVERLKKEKEENQFKIDNYENASKSLEKLIANQISDNNKKGLGYNVVPPPLTGLFAPPSVDLSSSGIEKFKEPEFEGYGVKVTKSASKDVSKEVKKTSDAPIIEDWVFDCDEDETMVLESLNVQKPKQADQPRKVSQNPRNNSTNWNTPKPKKLGVKFQVLNSPYFMVKSWLVQDQTVLGQTATGKESSNPFMAGSLPKTISPMIHISQEVILLKEERTVSKDSEVCKITRADGTSSFHGDFQALLRRLDRQDLFQLYSLVQERYKHRSIEGHDLDLWGDLKMMFDPNEEDDIWLNQHYWELLRWKLHEYSGVHSLFLDGTSIQINMLVDKKYPLKKEILKKMINLKIEAEEESDMASELIKFIKSQIAEQS